MFGDLFPGNFRVAFREAMLKEDRERGYDGTGERELGRKEGWTVDRQTWSTNP